MPFLDDFSTAKTAGPDTTYWMPGSGVYINNTLTTNHPSLNVATFDGVNATGSPYNFIVPLSQGFTDTLTSQPINLAGKTARDSIYISFYWEGKGLGEKPDSSDYISLEFLNSSQNWSTVWTQNGYVIDTVFKQQFIAIKDPGFFHNGFQFRFRGYGRSSGPYDTWHLDYVYLNDKRTANDKFIRDITVRKPLTPFLKNYTSMPLRQYKVNPMLATAATVSTDIVNLNNRENSNSFTFTVRDRLSGANYGVINDNSVYIAPYTGTGPFKNQERIMKLNPITFGASLTSASLQYKLVVKTTDADNPIKFLNLNRNDTISANVDLSDYYAFDDGSAEYGVQIPQKLGRAAVRYVLSKPDTIGGVRLSLVPFNKDISGQSFTVQLYSNKNGKPDQVLTQRSVSATYPDSRNGFLEYEFGNPVAVADTFYIGWL
ncbi:T9SS C-terminal target domain-containing protein [Dyadobacter sp. NIV53]|uniref:T9SS C-terminal target domain-containing protein n=1 Tax=Dyadobacter sp. NIV53 TaxID=2861765 RepID=UPI001C86B472|nr:T9SS C-terminal target domain-containing protein [Dyadobacter sp. NIV53]